MRVLVIVMIALPALAGCMGPDNVTPSDWAAPAPLRSFQARFQSAGCILDATFDGPTMILDDAMVRRDAYRLSLVLTGTGDPDHHGMPAGCPLGGTHPGGPTVVHLGQDLRVLRWSTPTWDDDENGEALQGWFFDLKGFLPPLGLFWERTASESALEYRVGTTTQKARLVTHDGWTGLEAPAPGITSVFLGADLVYRADGDVPKALRYEGRTDGTPVLLERMSISWGDPLPPLKVPPSPTPRSPAGGPLGLPAVEDDLFSMQTDLSRALDLILEDDPAAEAWFTQGCIQQVVVRSSGSGSGAPPLDLVTPARDAMDIRFDVALTGQVRTWTYTKAAPEDSLAGGILLPPEETTTSEDMGADDSWRTCGRTGVAHPRWSWTGFIDQTHSLGLDETLTPCSLRATWWPSAPVAARSPGVGPRLVVEALFSGHAQTNHPWYSENGFQIPPQTMIAVAATPDTGGLWTLRMPSDKAEMLDSGGWVPVPAPDPAQSPSGRPYRCVEPSEGR